MSQPIPNKTCTIMVLEIVDPVCPPSEIIHSDHALLFYYKNILSGLYLHTTLLTCSQNVIHKCKFRTVVTFSMWKPAFIFNKSICLMLKSSLGAKRPNPPVSTYWLLLFSWFLWYKTWNGSMLFYDQLSLLMSMISKQKTLCLVTTIPM